MSRVTHSSNVNYTKAASQKYIGSSLSRTVVRGLLACGGEQVYNWIHVVCTCHWSVGKKDGWGGWMDGSMNA